MATAPTPQMISLSEKLQEEMEAYKKLQYELSQMVESKHKIETSIMENKMVLEEFNRLGPDNSIYKLVGPALVAKETPEAKDEVQQRLDFLIQERDRIDRVVVESEKKVKDIADRVQPMSEKLQKLKARQESASS